MKFTHVFLVSTLIFVSVFSIIEIPESFEDTPRKKIVFTGEQKFFIDRERPSLSYFYSEPYSELPYKVNATVQVGDKKMEMFGEGFTQPIGYRYDKTCKKISGYENLRSDDGDSIRMDYNGIACIISPQKKVISVVFSGSENKGVFEGYIVGGTITGTSDFYERIYDLKINSIMITPRTK